MPGACLVEWAPVRPAGGGVARKCHTLATPLRHGHQQEHHLRINNTNTGIVRYGTSTEKKRKRSVRTSTVRSEICTDLRHSRLTDETSTKQLHDSSNYRALQIIAKSLRIGTRAPVLHDYCTSGLFGTQRKSRSTVRYRTLQLPRAAALQQQPAGEAQPGDEYSR